MGPADVLAASCREARDEAVAGCAKVEKITVRSGVSGAVGRSGNSDAIPVDGIENIIGGANPAKEIAPYRYVAAAMPYITVGYRDAGVIYIAVCGAGEMAAVFQHNQPAAVAVAAVVSGLSIADIVPAGLLAVFLANPLRVSVAA